MVVSAMRYLLPVLLVALALVLGVAPTFAQDVYPPPEGPVEVLPTVIEREPAPAPAPAAEPQPAVESLSATGVSATTIALVGLVILVVGGAVLRATRRAGQNR